MNDLLYHKKIFNHNPLNNKEYYFLRCIDKFNKLLQNKESIHFITMIMKFKNLLNLINY